MITGSTSPMKGWLRIKKTENKPSMQVAPNALEEGKCYLIQASSGAHIALYKGIEDDLHAFSVQRYTCGLIRWLDARYLETDFRAFMAFDDRMNPLVDFWYKLGASVGQRLPMEWFAMFEEASRLERPRPESGNVTPVSRPEHQHQQKKKRRPVFFADRKESLNPPSLSEQTPSIVGTAPDKDMSEIDKAVETEPEIDRVPVEDEPTTTEAVEAQAVPE